MLALLDQRKELPDRRRGEFCEVRRPRAGCEVGGSQREAQPDVVAVDDEDVAQAVARVRDGMDSKAAPVKRMRRVGHRDGVRMSQGRVADRGIDLVFR